MLPGSMWMMFAGGCSWLCSSLEPIAVDIGDFGVVAVTDVVVSVKIVVVAVVVGVDVDGVEFAET